MLEAYLAGAIAMIFIAAAEKTIADLTELVALAPNRRSQERLERSVAALDRDLQVARAEAERRQDPLVRLAGGHLTLDQAAEEMSKVPPGSGTRF